jgi:hypothetical protein
VTEVDVRGVGPYAPSGSVTSEIRIRIPSIHAFFDE